MKVTIELNEERILEEATKIALERVNRFKVCVHDVVNGKKHISGTTGQPVTRREHEESVRKWERAAEALQAAMAN